MTSLKVEPINCLYKVVIGVGGIGSGSFFILDGNHTIGREESRGGRFLDQKDYCKLHIITHYIKVLLGPHISVIPIGKVGNDDVGNRLLAEMEETEFNLQYVEKSADDQTLFSFCFIYPDGSGGNLTTSDSACSKVDAVCVSDAESEFARFAGEGIALAAPEVPLEARRRLLELGTKYDFFRVASFTSEEMEAVVKSGILKFVDLLAINVDEAAAITGISTENNTSGYIVETAIKALSESNHKMNISITRGEEGSWIWDGSSIHYEPVHKVNVESTAGAGDAFLSGIIAGLTAGLSLQEAQQLGSLTGGVSVQSPNTINKELNRESVHQLADKSDIVISEKILKLLEELL